MIDPEDGRVLLDRVIDRSWIKKPIGTQDTPPEYGTALFGLDHAVCVALGADWTPEEIVHEVQQLVESRRA